MSSPAMQTVETLASPDSSSRSERWFELGLVVLVVIVPLILSSLGAFIFGFTQPRPATSNYKHVMEIMMEAGGLALVWYVLRRSGRSFRSLGLRWQWKDLAVGFGLAILFWIVAAATQYGIREVFTFWTGAHPQRVVVTSYLFTGNSKLLWLFIATVPFFEEIIVRGYVTTELAGLTGSIGLATFGSVLLQASYHLYQGWVSATALFFAFLVLAIYYARTRNLLPAIAAHAVIDFTALAVYLRFGH